MVLQTWSAVLQNSLFGLWEGFIAFVPLLIGGVIVFILGWWISVVVGKAVSHILQAARVNKIFANSSVERTVSKAGYQLNVAQFLGEIVKWFLAIAFLTASLEILGLTQVNVFLQNVLAYIPQIIIAVLVLMAATIVSDFMKKLVSGSAKGAGLTSGKMLGTIVYYAIWIFAFIIALSELGIAPAFMQTLFIAIVGMLALAGGLSLGLGGKDLAARLLEKVKRDIHE
ncbi:MAG: hypothetical protein ACI9AR_000028 [Flavobacteriaceae bacterium]|jgi:hypothetical protein